MTEMNSPLRVRVAEELRAVLGRRNMSISELARRTGLKQPYLSRRVNGKVAFDLDDLETIATELGIDVTSLFCGDAPTAPFIPKQRTHDLVA